VRGKGVGASLQRGQREGTDISLNSLVAETVGES